MQLKIMIKSCKQSNLQDALVYYLENEKLDYIISSTIENIDEDITNLIYICEEDFDLDSISFKENIPVVFISDKKIVMNQDNVVINYIVTNLVYDENNYTNVQKEYLFKKGSYHTILQIVAQLLDNINQYNSLIYDLTEIRLKPDNWVFKFDSINDTYAWFLKKDKTLPQDFTLKSINFYSKKTYDDSLREINYLTQKVINIKSDKKIIDLFICTDEELGQIKSNYFFKTLLKNISQTYEIYLVDKNELKEKEPVLLSKLVDGIILYDDCVYRDNYSDEFSLGIVDCKKQVLEEYNIYFDDILKKYGRKLNLEDVIDGI